ncbi:NAD(P)-binding protein, partial [Violaceomyces palustris]
MPAYKSFVIAGAGNLGSNIATQLAKEGFQVTALSRVESDSDTSKLSSNGVKVHKVNYQDKASLSEAIKGHEVLINTLGAGSFQGDLHEALPTLAKEAGTQLYVPNDWGVDYSIVLESKHPEIHPFIASKPHVAEKLKGLGLPYLQFFPGVFGSYVALLLEVDKQARTAKVVGPGTAPFTSTTEKEIGQFVAKAFANLPKSELENRGLRV